MRQLLGLAGIVLAVFALAYDSEALIWAAMGVLGVSFVWRLIAARQARRLPRNDPPA